MTLINEFAQCLQSYMSAHLARVLGDITYQSFIPNSRLLTQSKVDFDKELEYRENVLLHRLMSTKHQLERVEKDYFDMLYRTINPETINPPSVKNDTKEIKEDNHGERS